MTSISDMKNGVSAHAEVFGIVKDIVQKEARNGSLFVIITISDSKDELAAKMWDMKASDMPFEPGVLVCMTVDGQMYNGTLSFIAQKIRRAEPGDGVTESDFIASAPVPSEKMYSYITGVFSSFENKQLSELCLAIYEANREKLMIWPAAQKMHHDIRGGLLYHTYRMLKSADAMADIYPEAEKDIVRAGVALHDIGKLEELMPNAGGGGQYTDDGTLFGHLYLGMRMIERYGGKLKTDKNIIRHLMHIVASHHGKREFGAIAVPQTTEAYVVSELDMLDSQLYIYNKAEENLMQGQFTPFYYKF